MASNKTYHLMVFGLSPHEMRVLRTISILSRSRSRAYVVENTALSDAVGFAVVDADDPRALADWHAFQVRNPMVPAVMVGSAPASEQSEHRIARPIMATRLLGILDLMQVSEQRPAFAPPKVDDNEPIQPSGLPPIGQQPESDTESDLRRALVVDDSLPIRRQMSLEAKRFVGQVDLAEDGEQAVELLASTSYDIVFLDVVLPGMDGYQICRTIKRDKRTKGTPVIMLTGKSSPFDRVRGKLAGCDTYLTKPVDQVKFDKVVNRLLN